MSQHHDLDQQAHVDQVKGVDGGETGALEEEAVILERDQEGRLEGSPCGIVAPRKGALPHSLGLAHDRGRSLVRGGARSQREADGGAAER